MLRIKLTSAGRAPVVISVDPATPLAAFRAQACRAFALAAASLFTSFPPRLLAGDDGAPLSLLLSTGVIVDVRAQASAALATVKMAPNGNCLFLSVAHLVGGDAPAQRESVVAAILSEPELYTEAVLGCAPGEYVAMISKDAVWGGAIELAVLAKLHETELLAVEIRSGTVYKFGEGAGYARAGLLLYDGLHYDVLVEECSGKRLFALAGDDMVRGAPGPPG